MTKNLLSIFILCFSFIISAQNQNSKWFFGQQAGLDFSTSPPTILTNGAVNANEGCASICDASSNLLFYTDGISVMNSNHVLMANGSGLLGTSSTAQSGIIVKQPGNNNFYYIFTLDQTASPNGARYSIVDMNLAVGFGSVTVKNATLYTPSCEKQVAIRHCNGQDIWIVSHEFNSNNFRSYLLTSAGLNTNPIITSYGDLIGGTGPNVTLSAIGQLKVSPDGRKLAMSTYSASSTQTTGQFGFYLFDFDAASGVISNSLSLNNNVTSAYGMEFSPDGSKLYGMQVGFSNLSNLNLYQWNICAGTHSAIIASEYSLSVGNLYFGSLQLASNGKIYLAALTQQSLSVINTPNASGSAMNFVLNGQSIAPKASGFGLPNYINPYTKATPAPFSNSIACQQVTFAVPPVPTFSSGCSTTPYAPNGYVWDFGDPVSGATNSSTLSNPTHQYSSTGTYIASLILINACRNDTIKKTIIITTLSPSTSVSGSMNICKGEKRTYTATGGSSYVWSNSSTASTIALSPTTTTVYYVTGVAGGCSNTSQFTITVNPCTSLSNIEKNLTEQTVKYYPNPFKKILYVKSTEDSNLIILDITGNIVLEKKIKTGENTIETENFIPGVYTLKTIGLKGTSIHKMINIE